MEAQIPSDLAAPIWRGVPNTALLLVNQSAVDVYVDDTQFLLNAVPANTTPISGTKVAATTGTVPFSSFTGVLWARAATPTKIQILAG